MDSVIKEFSEKRLGNIAFIRIQFSKRLFCQRVNNILVAVIYIGLRQYEVDNHTLLIAQQMQLESNIPYHCALAFLGNSLEHLHGELAFIVDCRHTGAVYKTDAGTPSETSRFKKHSESDKTTRHYLHKAVV